jgi:hypothetical protein
LHGFTFGLEKDWSFMIFCHFNLNSHAFPVYPGLSSGDEREDKQEAIKHPALPVQALGEKAAEITQF